MNVTERDELLVELKTAVVGMENTEDDGMAGTLRELVKQQKLTNGQVQKNTTFRKIGTWIGSIFFLTILGLCVTILTTGGV